MYLHNHICRHFRHEVLPILPTTAPLYIKPNFFTQILSRHISLTLQVFSVVLPQGTAPTVKGLFKSRSCGQNEFNFNFVVWNRLQIKKEIVCLDILFYIFRHATISQLFCYFKCTYFYATHEAKIKHIVIKLHVGGHELVQRGHDDHCGIITVKKGHRTTKSTTA